MSDPFQINEINWDTVFEDTQPPLGDDQPTFGVVEEQAVESYDWMLPSTNTPLPLSYLQPEEEQQQAPEILNLEEVKAEVKTAPSQPVVFLAEPQATLQQALLQQPPMQPEPEPVQQSAVQEPLRKKPKRIGSGRAAVRNVVGFQKSTRYYPPQQWAGTIPNSFVELQSYAVLRWSWLRIVDAATVPLPSNSCLHNIRQVFQLGNELKTGQYGTVYEATLVNNIYRFPVAIKYIKLQKPGIVVDTYKEVIAMAYLNSLMQMNICPHYPLMYEPFLCALSTRPPAFTEMTIVEEFADGELSSWLSEQRSEKMLMDMIFQISVGILASVTLLGLVNNDIKSSNILFNKVLGNTIYSYNIFGKLYAVPSDGFLFKIGDWGLVTGSLVTRDHGVAPSLVHDLTNLSSFSSKQAWEKTTYIRHPLSYRVNGAPIPPLKRDFLMFFYMLLNNARRQLFMPIEWLEYAVRYVNGLTVSTNEDIVQMFHHLFSDTKLKWSNVFTPALNAGGPNLNLQTFSMQSQVMAPVPILNVITENTLPRLPHLILPQ